MAESTENVYSINFDVDQFVANVQLALESMKKLEGNTDKLDDAMKLLQAQVNKVSFSKPIAETQKLQDEFEQLKKSGKIDLSQFNQSIDTFLKSAPEMESFLKEIRTLMKHLGEDSEEFKRLANVVNIVEKSLEDLKDAANDNDKGGFVPLKKRLKETKLAMQELEEQGKDNTEQYMKLRMEAARLTDQLGDQAEAIRVLSSDTFALDAAVDSVKTLAAGFQLMEGAMALAGGSSEEMQQTMVKLMAIMNIVNGLQEIQNFLTGQSPARLALQTVWTKALAVANGLLATSTTAAAGATSGLATALAATGIGAIVVAVGLLVAALVDWIDTSDDAKAATDRLNQSLEDQQKILAQNIARIERDNKVKIAQMKKDGATEQQIFDEQTKGMEDALNERRKTLGDSWRELMDNLAVARKRGNKEELEDLYKKQDALIKEKESIFDAEADIEARGLEFQADVNKKKKDERKKAYDDLLKLNEDYQKKLQQLENEALNLQDQKGPNSEDKIRQRYARELKTEQAENKKQFAKLGKAKIDALNKSAAQVNKMRADAEVKGFTKEQEQARDELVKDLRSQQQAVTNERIGLIRNEYERVDAEIKNREEERRQSITDQFNDTKKKINEDFEKGLITKDQADYFLGKAVDVMNDSLALIGEASAKALLENNRKMLQDLLNQAETFAQLQDAQAERIASQRVLDESERLKRGEITYEQYQKRVTQIQKDANAQRLADDIKQGEEKLAVLKKQLDAEEDETIKATISTTIAQTETAINTAKSQLNAIDKELGGFDSIIGKILGTKDKQEIDEFEQQVANAIKSTVDLLKQSASAEVEAADRAVESQRKRVDEAVKIAEQGNAEYLKQEEDRLRQLELKREQAARKQLQIDAAVQASQILVAVASATADSFRKGTGAVGVATGIAAIIAAIASGAALVKSLQNNQPKFFEGTDYVKRGRNPVGRDTIPAMLNEGEAVISTDVNKRYSPTIKAIRRGLIPEGVMNEFVNSYGKGINYHRVGQAIEINKASKFDDSKFIEMNERLGRLESVMTTTAQAIQGLGVNVKMDEDGFAASINTHLSRKNKVYNS